MDRACRADELWSVKGGAKQLVQKLADQSKATVHLGHDVIAIDARADGGYEVGRPDCSKLQMRLELIAQKMHFQSVRILKKVPVAVEEL